MINLINLIKNKSEKSFKVGSINYVELIFELI